MRYFVFLALFGAALAVPKPHQRIAGGQTASIQDYKFFADMQYSWSGVVWGSGCGGALLTTRSVLSAANCFLGDKKEQWRVRVGSSYTGTGGSKHPVRRIVLHPEYDNFNNDVAIIKLEEVVVLSSSVGLARLAGAAYILNEGARVTALGFGTVAAGGELPEQLQQVVVTIANQQTCASRYQQLKEEEDNNWPSVQDGMVCTSAVEGDVCYGDVGAPLVSERDIIYAITSWGKLCGDKDLNTVNTLVPKYVNWIVEIAENP